MEMLKIVEYKYVARWVVLIAATKGLPHLVVIAERVWPVAYHPHHFHVVPAAHTGCMKETQIPPSPQGWDVW